MRNGITGVIPGVLGLLLLVGCYSYPRPDAWHTALTKNTIDGYREYLENHNDGERAHVARTRIERALFAEARSANTEKAYEDFLESFPDGDLADEARLRLEKRIFARAVEDGKPQGFEAYRRRYPKGLFARVVGERIEDAYYRRAARAKSLAGFEDYLRRYPRGKHARSAGIQVERMYHDEATRTNTAAAYEGFIRRFPRSPYVSTCRKRARNIRLADAVREGRVADARKALAGGGDADSFTQDGAPLLVIASRYGSVALARMLLEAGAGVNEKTRDKGTTALMAASQRGHAELVDLLLQHKADPNCKARNGQTALSMASGRGDLAMVRRLIAGGARLDSRVSDGGVLQRAAEAGHVEVVRALLDSGLNARSPTAARALVSAVRAAAGSRIIVTHGDKTTSDIESDEYIAYGDDQVKIVQVPETTRAKYVEIVSLLKRAGADPDGWRIQGFRPYTKRQLTPTAILYRPQDSGRIVTSGHGGLSAIAFARQYGPAEVVSALTRTPTR